VRSLKVTLKLAIRLPIIGNLLSTCNRKHRNRKQDTILYAMKWGQVYKDFDLDTFSSKCAIVMLRSFAISRAKRGKIKRSRIAVKTDSARGKRSVKVSIEMEIDWTCIQYSLYFPVPFSLLTWFPFNALLRDRDEIHKIWKTNERRKERGWKMWEKRQYQI